MERLNVATTPALSTVELGHCELVWTRHAAGRALDKLHWNRLPASLRFGRGCVVEVERVAGGLSSQLVGLTSQLAALTKAVVRFPLMERPGIDAVLVLVPRGRDVAACGWTVITAWVNAADDKHATLRTSRLGPKS